MTPVRKAAATREQLIDATEQLMCEGGLAAITTQSVARTCGFSEGTIYRHFASREELIVTTLRERLPGEFRAQVQALSDRAGAAPLDENLLAFIRGMMPIFATVAPSLGMLASDPGLAARNAEAMCADGNGPRFLIEEIAKYFAGEQRLGRIEPGTDLRAAAGLLVGLCFYRSLMQHLFGEDPTALSDEAFPAAVASIIARGVAAKPAASAPARRTGAARAPKRKKSARKA